MTLSLSHCFHSFYHCISWILGFFFFCKMSAPCIQSFISSQFSSLTWVWSSSPPAWLMTTTWGQILKSPSWAAPSSRAPPLTESSMLSHGLQMNPVCQTHSPPWPGLTPPWNLGFPLHHNHNALPLPNWSALTFPRYAMPFQHFVPCACPLAHLAFPPHYPESFRSHTLNLHCSVRTPRRAAPKHPGFRTLLHT